jgi:hypothetical protein
MRHARERRFALGAVALACALTAGACTTPTAPPPSNEVARLEAFASAPPDHHDRPEHPDRHRPSRSEDLFITDANDVNSLGGGIEPAIAVNPLDPNEIVIMTFRSGINRAGGWPDNAPLFVSHDGGRTWTKQFSIPPPPGRVKPGTPCPCNHSIAFGQDGTLYAALLTDAERPCGTPAPGILNCNVVTGSTSDPSDAAAWHWNADPVQLTNSAHPNSADQPWIAVAPDPARLRDELVHVAYDDFAGGPRAQVATARAASPLDFTRDTSPGSEATIVSNPGLRIAADRHSGALYAFWERAGATAGTVSYVLNRSLDGGATWGLNGSADGVVVETVKSNQGFGQKFAGINAFLGGLDHVTVGPDGDVYVVYGADLAGTGLGDQLVARRIWFDSRNGRMVIGDRNVVTNAVSAALPSIAVTDDGTVGVLYDTSDGISVDGDPILSAHLARGTANGHGHGAHADNLQFRDVVLEQFTSPNPPMADVRQRELGDHQQLVALGNTFYGAFAGGAAPFGGTFRRLDPIFFRVESGHFGHCDDVAHSWC